MKSVILDDDDDEAEPLFVKFGHPFADTILTPSAIKRKSSKAVYVDAYHELAYLHPNRFAPDPSVLRDSGIEEGEPYFILRFNAFKAHHDIGAEGLSIENKRRLVERLSASGKVFITTERNIDDEFKLYQLTVSPDKAHSLMYYATMFVGDSQTMTSEAAVLGTPAVKCNSFAGRLAVPNELEHKYGLCYSFLPEQQDAFFAKIEELLAMPDLKGEWQRRRQHLFSEKIDYTSFLVWFVENYPQSRQTIVEQPEFQFQFR
jgi:predicted glycosyltransferase